MINNEKQAPQITKCPPATEMDLKRSAKRAKMAARLPGVSLGVRLDHDIVEEKKENLIKARAVLASRRSSGEGEPPHFLVASDYACCANDR